MKTIGIIGSRRRNAPEDFLKVQEAFCQIYEEGDRICSGLCPRGGDSFAVTLKQIWDAPYVWHRAKWRDEKNNYRRWAGFERNTNIAYDSDILIACVAADRKGGTEDTIKKFKKFHGYGKIIFV